MVSQYLDLLLDLKTCNFYGTYLIYIKHKKKLLKEVICSLVHTIILKREKYRIEKWVTKSMYE